VRAAAVRVASRIAAAEREDRGKWSRGGRRGGGGGGGGGTRTRPARASPSFFHAVAVVAGGFVDARRSSPERRVESSVSGFGAIAGSAYASNDARRSSRHRC
jgi:hypothetical protein